jgi:hypothetical protein
MNNPILATLKAKRGMQNMIGFGSKPPISKPKIEDKPENYLGPGYYEYKGTFDNSQAAAQPQKVSANGIIQVSRSQQYFLSSQSRWGDA